LGENKVVLDVKSKPFLDKFPDKETNINWKGSTNLAYSTMYLWTNPSIWSYG